MKRFTFLIFTVLVLTILTACGGNKEETDEVLPLEVDFIVPESIEVGETVELKAEVMYGDDIETDAEVNFEVWESGDEDNSDMLEAENNGDGTYTAEYTFEHEGVFEMYAHTDAQHLHTMPKKEVTVGEGGEQ
ncbi:FixH family protein [Pseudogracilibacillus sp. SO30301A]|uniref:FixH family protein n=1 Tax=Pseudogracilibacillus sp. SO30301A TaxID=3098291 RepID=UPI00300E66F2